MTRVPPVRPYSLNRLKWWKPTTVYANWKREERKEIIRILTNFTNKVRPYVREMMDSYRFLAKIDLIQAKAKIAEIFKAIEPEVEDHPHIDWIRAIHPLLRISLGEERRKGSTTRHYINARKKDTDHIRS